MKGTSNTIYQRTRDRKNNPKGVLVAKKIRGTVKFGWSLTNFKAGDKFNLEAGLKVATNRAEKSDSVEIPASIQNDYVNMVTRGCRYFFKGRSVKVVPA